MDVEVELRILAIVFAAMLLAQALALAAWVATKALRRAAATMRRSRATRALQPEATGAGTPG